jgi:RNA polymerase sigma-70 factor (ECF subfamily)
MDEGRTFFEKLYEAHCVDVKRFIYTEARRDAEATEDIFQNTWENAYRYLDTLRERDKAVAWLYSIARNEARRYFSRLKKVFLFESASLDDEKAPDPPDDGANSFPDALADADLLAELIGQLSEDEQQLLLLRYRYDVSFTDIADMLGANYNTVKSVALRATRKLRKLAEVYGDER